MYFFKSGKINAEKQKGIERKINLKKSKKTVIRNNKVFVLYI